jgi:hypothetical protein
MTLAAECGPPVELGGNVITCGPRKSPERVSDEVGTVGNLELVAKAGQRIGGVQFRCVEPGAGRR